MKNKWIRKQSHLSEIWLGDFLVQSTLGVLRAPLLQECARSRSVGLVAHLAADSAIVLAPRSSHDPPRS